MERKKEVSADTEMQQQNEEKNSSSSTPASTEEVAKNFPQNSGNNSQASEMTSNGQSDYR